MIALTVFLIASVTTSADDGPGPAELVRRLGAERYEDRQAAEQVLRALGPGALPALREGVLSRDAEIRKRSGELVAAIERRSLSTPTMLTLDFRDQTLERIVESINGRNGIRLGLSVPVIDPIYHRRLTLRSSGPVTFWEAVGQLCKAGGLRTLPSNHFVNPGSRPSNYLMPSGADPGECPYVNSGPFRVTLESLALEGQLRPGMPAGRQKETNLSARLQIEAESRMYVVPVGQIGWIEAVNDLGQSLVPPGFESPRRDPPEGGFGSLMVGSPERTSRITVNASLQASAKSGRILKRLRGVQPVLVAAPEPRPLVVTLSDKEESKIEDDRVAITVGAIRPKPNQGRLIMTPVELNVRPLGTDVIRAWMLLNQIEIFDADGKSLRLGHVQVDTSRDGARVRLNLIWPAPTTRAGVVLPAPAGFGVPARLVYHHLFTMPADVAFSFEDLPLP